MAKSIFREKSVERISSPEQLNDYIKVCSPSLWIVLAAVILLLAGTVIWGVFGQFTTVLNTVAVAEDGALTVYVKAPEIESVKGKPLLVDGAEYTVTDEMCSREPAAVDSSLSDYAKHLGDLKNGEWAYRIRLDADLQDGVYPAQIVTENISAVLFVIN